ncbi:MULTISPECIES: sugar phosphate nucleotidyltransferase [Oceanotoga]|jgi:dTDP-glucose pyrophosphorylase|uniref:sugar phosphate nucleotidyltransferase n=1 Tax=Oceanotoga TaxID=1255275 RepID=UPI00264B6240|nr:MULTISPECIES: sugar phosphate nucleotidyltransferase [Oceanotoga]MDN5342779.1 hypothetical protein [Oceanotoga sp.]MDO7975800.1 sugar phosphate nucleotidyltransferase [Oceanotoga teriensis]
MDILDLRYFKIIDEYTKKDKIIEYINDSIHKILFVVKDEILIGCITDGDLRRKIKSDDFVAKDIMNDNPKFIFEEDFENKNQKELINNMVNYLPILNSNKKLLKIIYFDINFQEYYDINNTKVVIMAGGKGVRLLPITKIIPKPLVPFKEKTIIENIMEQFIKYGFYDFIFTINYKKEMIKTYFDELDYNISYIEEDNFLGTAGSLAYISSNNPIIVSNCDILLDIDYSKAVKEHILNDDDITIFTAREDINIPYGVIKQKDNIFVDIEEKPILSYMVNTGIYILNPNVLKLIKKGEEIDMPDLISRAKLRKMSIRVYNSNKKMIDIGQWDYYKKFINK